MRLIRQQTGDDIEFMYGVMIGLGVGFGLSTILFAIGWAVLA